jgi:hypothetical protein
MGQFSDRNLGTLPCDNLRFSEPRGETIRFRFEVGAARNGSVRAAWFRTTEPPQIKKYNPTVLH